MPKKILPEVIGSLALFAVVVAFKFLDFGHSPALDQDVFNKVKKGLKFFFHFKGLTWELG